MTVELTLVSHDLEAIETNADVAQILASAAIRHGLAGTVQAIFEKSHVTCGSMTKSVSKRHDHLAEPTPERWMRDLVERSRQEYRSAARVVAQNVDTYIQHVVDGRRVKKGLGAPPRYYLDEDNLIELIELIEANWRAAVLGRVEIGDWPTPSYLRNKWAKWGVVSPDTNLLEYVRDSLTLGRLSSIVELADDVGYDRALAMAAEHPWSRTQELTWRVARDRAARYMVGVGRRIAADETYDLVLEQNREITRDLIARYRRGELDRTLTNRARLRAQEVEALERPGVPVSGWRSLARELRNRMLAEDGGERDWMRVATTETRSTANMGYLFGLIDQGHAPEETTIYYLVQPTACKYCVQLYLNEDGSPKLFPLSEILANVEATGGMNIGRKASKIGDDLEGWLPNANTHPWCQCRPRRLIPGMKPIRIERPVLPRRS